MYTFRTFTQQWPLNLFSTTAAPGGRAPFVTPTNTLTTPPPPRNPGASRVQCCCQTTDRSVCFLAWKRQMTFNYDTVLDPEWSVSAGTGWLPLTVLQVTLGHLLPVACPQQVGLVDGLLHPQHHLVQQTVHRLRHVQTRRRTRLKVRQPATHHTSEDQQGGPNMRTSWET